MTKAGNQTIIAQPYGTIGSAAFGFTVQPAAPSKLVFTSQPVTVAAGMVISPAVTVLVRDLYGNPVRSSTVKISLIPVGSATLGGTVSVMSSPQGIATFKNLTVSKAGTYQLVATDGSLSATSNSFQVTSLQEPSANDDTVHPNITIPSTGDRLVRDGFGWDAVDAYFTGDEPARDFATLVATHAGESGLSLTPLDAYFAQTTAHDPDQDMSGPSQPSLSYSAASLAALYGAYTGTSAASHRKRRPTLATPGERRNPSE
jgi:hypothetical protein